jgi:hypothetical protein
MTGNSLVPGRSAVFPVRPELLPKEQRLCCDFACLILPLSGALTTARTFFNALGSSITGKEREEIARLIEEERKHLRLAYPEIHGKVVDFITHTVTDGTLYVSVRFTDNTNFSIRYASEMFVVGVDLADWKTGNMKTIREYMKPIPR